MKSPIPLTIAAVLGWSACATTGPSTIGPTPSLTAEDSASSIRAAEEVGAAHTPEAALHLQLAKEQFDHARKLTGEADRDEAARLLLRAQADAELALALARGETEKLQVQAANDKVKALNESAPQ